MPRYDLVVMRVVAAVGHLSEGELLVQSRMTSPLDDRGTVRGGRSIHIKALPRELVDDRVGARHPGNGAEIPQLLVPAFAIVLLLPVPISCAPVGVVEAKLRVLSDRD